MLNTSWARFTKGNYIILYNKIGNSSSKQSVNPNIILTQNEVRSVSLTDIETEKYLSLKMEPPILKVNTFAKSTSTAFKNNVKLTSSQQVPKMAVCVKPFHFEFNKALGLVEFIEMYRLQGAVHFMFYNHTLGQDVTKATIICLMFLPSKNTARDNFLFWNLYKRLLSTYLADIMFLKYSNSVVAKIWNAFNL